MTDLSSAKYYNKTATGAVINGAGTIDGVIVNSHTSGTMKLWDSLSAAGNVIVNTFTFPAGSGIYKFPKSVEFQTGLFLTVGGTLDITLIATPN